MNEVDRKYNERKLFYENLLLKQKLSKYGINNEVYGETVSSYNNTTYRGDKTNEIIDNKLKPIEAKQNNFIQMIHNLLYNNNNGKRPYYNDSVIHHEMNRGNFVCANQQRQTSFVVQNSCWNEIYGHKCVDVGSIVKENVLENVKNIKGKCSEGK